MGRAGDDASEPRWINGELKIHREALKVVQEWIETENFPTDLDKADFEVYLEKLNSFNNRRPKVLSINGL